MERREVGVLGLPKGFSEDPIQRRADFWQAIKVGYDRISKRFGKFASNRWEPAPSTVLIFDTAEEFVSRVFEATVDAPEEWKVEFATNPPLARTLYNGGQVFINGSGFINPLEVAQLTAHETIHAWARKMPIKFVEIAPEDTGYKSEIGVEYLEYIADKANEALIDFSAFEALGLLKPPITRLNPLRLLNKALNALLLRESAEAFRPNVEDVIMRITQGKYKGQEIALLNRRMGTDPLFGSLVGFYEAGFLFPIGSLHTGGLSNEQIMTARKQNLIWTATGLRITSSESLMKYSLRPDFQQASAMLTRGTETAEWAPY